MIEGIDYFVRLTDFPAGAGVHGMVLLNEDGTYSVYLDRNATDEQKAASLRHELEHIEHDHLHGEKNVSAVEAALPDEAERGYMESWLDWMEWCRKEMLKKGITPMMP